MIKRLNLSIPLIALIMISCASDISSSINTFTVVFDSRGGSDIPVQIVEPNSFILPPDVSKEGHILKGWYTSFNGGVNLENKWNFFTDRVDINLTLYASWTEMHEIEFISLGGSYSSALTSSGRVYLWGYNQFGELGDGTTIDRNLPTEITSSFSLTSGEKINLLSLGHQHSSALTSTGRVFMWGYNFYGQLGDGTTINRNLPTEITSRFSLSAGDKIISVSLSGYLSSALSSTGRVFMWGRNLFGELGNGTTTDRYNPTEITSRFLLTAGDKIISVSLGRAHSSALSLTGRVFMWGFNYSGRLGDGTSTNRNTPTEITSSFSLTSGDKINLLTLGGGHSSALSLTGRVFMWGDNSHDQIGDSQLIDSQISFGKIRKGEPSYRNTPTEITSSFSLTSGDKINLLTLGGGHSSALSLSGRVFMWGNNVMNELGDGSNINLNTPTEITSRFSLTAGDKIISISLGDQHSSALTLTGRVFMWGWNENGLLGDGTVNNRNIPTLI
jgi:alpha-tubulin suppressor-like RCC1 family protein